jgi:hypothetical protein
MRIDEIKIDSESEVFERLKSEVSDTIKESFSDLEKLSNDFNLPLNDLFHKINVKETLNGLLDIEKDIIYKFGKNSNTYRRLSHMINYLDQ